MNGPIIVGEARLAASVVLTEMLTRQLEGMLFDLARAFGACPACPACGGHVGIGYFDYRMCEFGPREVRDAYCFDCGWALMCDGTVVAGRKVDP